MSEKKITISPKLTNGELQGVPTWRHGPGRSEVGRQALQILDELTERRVPWSVVFTHTTPITGFNPIEQKKRTSAAVVKIDTDLSAKLGMVSAEVGWGLGDPQPVYMCGAFGLSVIEGIAGQLAASVAGIENGDRKFETPEAERKAERLAREKLLLFDNDNPKAAPLGYKQLTESALSTYSAENPALQLPFASEFLRTFLTGKEYTPEPRRSMFSEMCKILKRDDYETALAMLTQILNTPVPEAVRLRRKT